MKNNPWAYAAALIVGCVIGAIMGYHFGVSELQPHEQPNVMVYPFDGREYIIVTNPNGVAVTPHLQTK